MDPVLMAHAMILEDASKTLATEPLKLRFAALDMLDYLGKKIDEDKAREAKATRP